MTCTVVYVITASPIRKPFPGNRERVEIRAPTVSNISYLFNIYADIFHKPKNSIPLADLFSVMQGLPD